MNFGSAPHISSAHPMSAEISVSACGAVEQHINGSERLNSVWKTTDEENVHSVVGCVPIFNEKTRTTLKSGGLTFYRRHGTLLKFSERMRRVQILSGATVLAYLPVAFQSDLNKF